MRWKKTGLDHPTLQKKNDPERLDTGLTLQRNCTETDSHLAELHPESYSLYFTFVLCALSVSLDEEDLGGWGNLLRNPHNCYCQRKVRPSLNKTRVPFAEIWAFHSVCVPLSFTLRYVTHMHLHTYFVISIGHSAILINAEKLNS